MSKDEEYCQRECCGYFHAIYTNKDGGCPYNQRSLKRERAEHLNKALSGVFGVEIAEAAKNALLTTISKDKNLT